MLETIHLVPSHTTTVQSEVDKFIIQHEAFTYEGAKRVPVWRDYRRDTSQRYHFTKESSARKTLKKLVDDKTLCHYKDIDGTRPLEVFRLIRERRRVIIETEILT